MGCFTFDVLLFARCWYGEWSAGSSTGTGMPKCVGSPCRLPEPLSDFKGYVGGNYQASVNLKIPAITPCL